MSLPNAAWINFLRKYGPSAANDNMYDETIEQSRRRAGVDPIVLPTPLLDEAIACLTGPRPVSVILTGTAGDGKTYYCRQIWDLLGGAAADWADDAKASQGMYSVKYKGRTIHIVKDLSEVEKGIARTVLARVSKDVVEGAEDHLYVIAANHGQLYEQWLQIVNASSAARQAWQSIEDQLVGGETDSPVALRLFDLSRRPASESLRQVLDAVIEHPRWQSCEGCHLHEPGAPCPILENRERLRSHGAGNTFRQRLIALMEISTQNNQHVPVRHQLMLVANILLGHRHAKDGLMACTDIEPIQRAGIAWRATPYGNAVGENLTPRKRRNREIFEKLDRLGLGHETSNKLDRLLTIGSDDPDLQADYHRLVESDPIYGHTIPWRRAQAAYLESGAYDEANEEDTSFKVQMRLQRQRLFFTMPEAEAAEYDVWALSVYQNAAVFLGVLDSVRAGRAVSFDIVRRLVRGLNRVFTGELVEDNDHLILATAGSNSQARTNLLYEAEISARASRGEAVTVIARPPRGIALRVQLARVEDLEPVDLPLTVLRFEFLTRVADGALPSSFSLECYEDMLAYKARVLAKLAERRRLEGEPASSNITLKFVELLADGRVRPREVEIYSS